MGRFFIAEHMARGLEGDHYHPVNFSFTTEKGGPSSDGTPDPNILAMVRDFSGRILDLGAGDGRYTTVVLAQPEVDAVVAADKNPDSLATLRNFRAPEDHVHKLETFPLDAFAELPFGENTFDGVMSTALLHLRPPEHIRSSMEEMARVTKPGGLLVVDLSTDIQRVYTAGKRKGEEAKGPNEVRYSFQQGTMVLGKAVDGLFDVQRRTESDMNLSLSTQDGPVHLTTKKINVLARRK